MTRINKYKESLKSGEKKFLEEYEPSIKEFINNLEEDNLINHNYTQEQIIRLQKLMRSSNAAAHLFENFNKIITADKKQTKSNIKKLKEFGLRIDTIADQYGTVMCHMYQVTMERLRLFIIILINISCLGIKNPGKQPIGKVIKKLRAKYPTNHFLQYLKTNIRNAIAHYSYFFEKNSIALCNGYFDPNPTFITIEEFMKTSKKLSILTDTFMILFLDKYKPGGKLILDTAPK